MSRIAVISPSSLPPIKFTKRIIPILPDADLSDAVHLSNMGNHLDINNTGQQPAHSFASLTKQVSAIVVVREFPLLYPNDFTVAWLLKLLLDIHPNGSIYIEIDETRKNSLNHRLTPDIFHHQYGINGKIIDGRWVAVRQSDISKREHLSLKSIYPMLHGQFEYFYEQWCKLNPCRTDVVDSQNEAMRTFIYALHGANQKSFIIERILADYGITKSAQGLDMGGGFGFLGAELAVKGHRVTTLDYNKKNIELGKLIWRQFNIEKGLNLSEGNIEKIDQISGNYDFLSYFGCLLYIKREKLAGILQHSMELLKPGGLLLIHENPKEAGRTGSRDYERRFEADELFSLIQEHAGLPVFYNIFLGKKTEWEKVKDKLIMAVIKKK